MVPCGSVAAPAILNDPNTAQHTLPTTTTTTKQLWRDVVDGTLHAILLALLGRFLPRQLVRASQVASFVRFTCRLAADLRLLTARTDVVGAAPATTGNAGGTTTAATTTAIAGGGAVAAAAAAAAAVEAAAKLGLRFYNLYHPPSLSSSPHTHHKQKRASSTSSAEGIANNDGLQLAPRFLVALRRAVTNDDEEDHNQADDDDDVCDCDGGDPDADGVSAEPSAASFLAGLASCLAQVAARHCGNAATTTTKATRDTTSNTSAGSGRPSGKRQVHQHQHASFAWPFGAEQPGVPAPFVTAVFEAMHNEVKRVAAALAAAAANGATGRWVGVRGVPALAFQGA